MSINFIMPKTRRKIIPAAPAQSQSAAAAAAE